MIVSGYEAADMFDLPAIKRGYDRCSRVMRSFGEHWQPIRDEPTETPLEFLIHNVFYLILNATSVDIMEEWMIDHLNQMEALSFLGDMFLDETDPEEFCRGNVSHSQLIPN